MNSFVTLPPPYAHQLTPFFNLTSSLHTGKRREEEEEKREKQRWGSKQKRKGRKSREEVGSTVSALTRLMRRK